MISSTFQPMHLTVALPAGAIKSRRLLSMERRSPGRMMPHRMSSLTAQIISSCTELLPSRTARAPTSLMICLRYTVSMMPAQSWSWRFCASLFRESPARSAPGTSGRPSLRFSIPARPSRGAISALLLTEAAQIRAFESGWQGKGYRGCPRTITLQ